VEKLKLIWSEVAIETFEEILNFYTVRNQNENYSRKLYQMIMKDIRLLEHVPNIGIKTRIKNVRGLIINDFIIYYEIKHKFIFILTIWDCTQNPEDNKFVMKK
jgi:plasmid stabilization system protein ParE